jgi:hypothetical protein
MSATWKAYFIGPFYVLLPKRWRKDDRHGAGKYLARAALFSGVLEALIALIALAFWYLMFFGVLDNRYAHYLTETLSAVPYAAEFVGEGGVIGLIVNPFTWVIVYFGFEGAARAFAALATGEVVGILPLYILEFAWRHIRPKRAVPEPALVADEVTPGGGTCDIQIASCRQREGWAYPFTLRYAGGYFQVMEHKCISVGPRPYIYKLRRLPIGEPARGLQYYDPSDILNAIPKLDPL